MMNTVGPLVWERAKLFDGDALSVLAELDALYEQWAAEKRKAERASGV